MVIASELIDFMDSFQNIYKNLAHYYFSWTWPGPAFRLAFYKTYVTANNYWYCDWPRITVKLVNSYCKMLYLLILI